MNAAIFPLASPSPALNRRRGPATGCENLVLGAIIESGGLNLPPNLARLLEHAPESFDDLRHGEVALTIRKLLREGKPVHAGSVATACGIEDGFTLVSQLLASALEIPTAECEAAELCKAFNARQTCQAIGEAAQAISEHPEAVHAIASNLIQTLDSIAGDQTGLESETIVRHLNEFHADDIAATENTLLGNRYLCRGGALLIAGPTGIGKSSLAYQAGISWALGKTFHGIRPSQPLRVLIVQAENDDGDMSEIRDGIFRGLNLTDGEQATACQQIQVVCETVATGQVFVSLLSDLVAQHKPDLVIIDPLFAYCGCGVSDQERMSQFLRNWINPILQDHKCGLILVHHTNKPKTGSEKPDWKAGDFAYLGSGTTEIANWARAVIGIRSVGSHQIFEIVLGKRGKRAGLVDDQGDTLYSFHAKHATSGICWDPASADELDTGGRPKQSSADEVLSVLPPEGLTASDWQKAACKECGIKETTFHRCRRDLAKADRVIKSKASGNWQPITKKA